MTQEIHGQMQRWPAKRRSAWVLSLLMGAATAAEAARQHALTVAVVEDWLANFLHGAENALCSRSRNEEALNDEEIKRLKQIRPPTADHALTAGARLAKSSHPHQRALGHVCHPRSEQSRWVGSPDVGHRWPRSRDDR